MGRQFVRADRRCVLSLTHATAPRERKRGGEVGREKGRKRGWMGEGEEEEVDGRWEGKKK